MPGFDEDKNIDGRIYRYRVIKEWNKGKPRRKSQKYLGRVIIDSKGKEILIPKKSSALEIQRVLPTGQLALFMSIVEDLNLGDILHTCARSINEAPEIPLIILTLNQLNGRLALDRLGRWVGNTPLETWLEVDGKALTKDVFLKSLDRICSYRDGVKENLGPIIQQNCVEAWKTYLGEDVGEMYYDVTRLTYYGNRCLWAKKGYGLDNRKKRKIGVGLVVSRRSKLPVLCMPIKGSRNDKSTVERVLFELNTRKFRRITLIFDRGMVSQGNLVTARNSYFSVICGCPESDNDVLEALERWDDDDIEKPGQMIMRKGGPVYIKGWNEELFGLKGRLLVSTDPVMRAEEKQGRNWAIQELRELIKKPKKGSKKRVRSLLAGLKDIVQKRGRGIAVDEEMLEKVNRRSGRFLLFSTGRRYSDREIFQAYFQKDEIEKVFRTEKGMLGLKPVKYLKEERVEAYLTINFLAYLIWSVIDYRLRKKRIDLSVSKVVSILSGLKTVELKWKDKQQFHISRADKKQKELIKLFKLDRFLHSP